MGCSLHLPGIAATSGLACVRGGYAKGKTALLGSWAGEWLLAGLRVGMVDIAHDQEGMRSRIASQVLQRPLLSRPTLPGPYEERITCASTEARVEDVIAACRSLLATGHQALLLDDVPDHLRVPGLGLGDWTEAQRRLARGLRELLVEQEAFAVISCSMRVPFGGSTRWNTALASQADLLLSIQSPSQGYASGGRMRVEVDKHRGGLCPSTSFDWQPYGLDLVGPSARWAQSQPRSRPGSLTDIMHLPRGT